VSDCGRYVVLYISKGAEPRNKIYYCDLEKFEGRKITGEPVADLKAATLFERDVLLQVSCPWRN
jgi:hypothetical protein